MANTPNQTPDDPTAPPIPQPPGDGFPNEDISVPPPGSDQDVGANEPDDDG